MTEKTICQGFIDAKAAAGGNNDSWFKIFVAKKNAFDFDSIHECNSMAQVKPGAP